MKNKILLLFLLSPVLFLSQSIAQSVGISAAAVGSFTPNVSAMLDISSSTLGLLVPKSTTPLLPATLAAAAQGLLFYNTTSTANFLYINSSNNTTATWAALPSSILTNNLGLSGTSLTSTIVNNGTSYPSTPLNLASTIIGATWNLAGNTISTGNFIGTSAAQDLVFAANGIERLRIASTGNVGIGTAGSNSTLEVSGTIGAKITVVNASNTYSYSNGLPIDYTIGSSNAYVYYITAAANLPTVKLSGYTYRYVILPPVNSTCGFLNRRYVFVNASSSNIIFRYPDGVGGYTLTYYTNLYNGSVYKLYGSASGVNSGNTTMEILADPVSLTWIQVK